MSLDIAAAKYSLIAEVRQDWVYDQQRKALITGKAAEPVPSDSELIAEEPPLAQEIAALQSQQIPSNSQAQSSNYIGADSPNSKIGSDISQSPSATSYSKTVVSTSVDGHNILDVLA